MVGEVEVTFYQVPSMADIRAVPPTGLRMVSTFSGCGGSCLGFRMAGFDVAWASEFVPAAQETYRANSSPSTILDTRDIRKVTASEILEQTGLRPGELDVFEGSPPCASFSMAGKREAGWGKVKAYSDTAQRTDDLFYEYARLLDGLRPKVFVAENVAGLVRGTAKGYFKLILDCLKNAGYRVEARLLDAQWLDTPQIRKRLIFVGVRNDLNLPAAFPAPHPHPPTVGDALATLPTQTAADLAPASMEGYAVGTEWKRLRPGQSSTKYINLVRASFGRPVPTITAKTGDRTAASVTHPTECRKFTVAETRRLCGFPDDFVLTGSYEQQIERLGRAVPPTMMRAVAETIRDRILIDA